MCCHCCCWRCALDSSGVKEGECVPTQKATEGIQYQKYAQNLGYELKSTHKFWVMSLKYAQYAQKVVCMHKSGFWLHHSVLFFFSLLFLQPQSCEKSDILPRSGTRYGIHTCRTKKLVFLTTPHLASRSSCIVVRYHGLIIYISHQ